MSEISLGTHHLVEFFNCNAPHINNREQLREAMLKATELAGATIVTDVFHSFEPYGLTGVVVIAESHFSVHTWPEYKCATLDMYSCSEKIKPELAIKYMYEFFQAEKQHLRIIERGLIEHVMPVTKT